jgi:hypothetical protein
VRGRAARIDLNGKQYEGWMTAEFCQPFSGEPMILRINEWKYTDDENGQDDAGGLHQRVRRGRGWG